MEDKLRMKLLDMCVQQVTGCPQAQEFVDNGIASLGKEWKKRREEAPEGVKQMEEIIKGAFAAGFHGALMELLRASRVGVSEQETNTFLKFKYGENN